jgi:hypothetical protein
MGPARFARGLRQSGRFGDERSRQGEIALRWRRDRPQIVVKGAQMERFDELGQWSLEVARFVEPFAEGEERPPGLAEVEGVAPPFTNLSEHPGDAGELHSGGCRQRTVGTELIGVRTIGDQPGGE